jgi:hypothetical protein
MESPLLTLARHHQEQAIGIILQRCGRYDLYDACMREKMARSAPASASTGNNPEIASKLADGVVDATGGGSCAKCDADPWQRTVDALRELVLLGEVAAYLRCLAVQTPSGSAIGEAEMLRAERLGGGADEDQAPS